MQSNAQNQQATQAAFSNTPAPALPAARLRTVAFSLLVDRALAA